MNLTEILQQHFEYAPLLKIDPNTQGVAIKDTPVETSIGQAAIPVILIGLYKFSRTDAGAAAIVSGDSTPDWVHTIFSDQSSKIIKRVSEYAATTYENTESTLNNIAGKAVAVIKEAVAPDYKLPAVKDLMSAQRNDILTYLPAVLHTGELIDDPTVDDRTNKMEGPVSSLIQAIGSGFTGSDKDVKSEI